MAGKCVAFSYEPAGDFWASTYPVVVHRIGIDPDEVDSGNYNLVSTRSMH
jgi:hypothetical protein